MKPGIYDGIPLHEYLKIDALASSTLTRFHESPAHSQVPTIETDAMRLGSAFHALVLEPEKFRKEYGVAPTGIRRGSKAWAEAELDNAGKNVLKAEDYDKIKSMAEAVNRSKTARGLLRGGVMERTLIWRDKRTDLLCKGRMDCHQGNLIIDLKSAKDASEYGFQGAIGSYLYHWQAWFYLTGATEVTGIEHRNFLWIAVEKKPPFGVGIYAAGKESLDKASVGIYDAMTGYAECKRTGVWPCYPDRVQELSAYGR